jgi:hypothetical protein
MHSAYLLGLYQDGYFEAAAARTPAAAVDDHMSYQGAASLGEVGGDAAAGRTFDGPVGESAALDCDGSVLEYGSAASRSQPGDSCCSSEVVLPSLGVPSAVLLGLRQRLLSLELSQVVFDSDYTLMMLGCISSLTYLKARLSSVATWNYMHE